MLEHSSSSSHAQARAEIVASIRGVNFFLAIFCIAMVAASFFSLPFPFVRSLWIKEVWGVSGLIHAIIILWVIHSIGKIRVYAPLAGLGLLLSDQLLLWHGFIRLAETGGIYPQAVLFAAFSSFTGFLFASILGYALFKIYFYRSSYPHHKEENHAAENESLHYGNAILSVLAYGGSVIFVIVASKYENHIFLYAAYKLFSSVVGVAGMTAVGYEIKKLTENQQSAKFITVKILSHLLAMAGVLVIIHRLLPIQHVLSPT